MARAMRLQANLPLHLAPFAVQYAACLYNSLPHKALKGHTPEEAWTGEVPDLSEFRVFGSKVWVMSTIKHPAKFDTRSRVGVFLGVARKHKGHLCYFPETNRVVVTHQPVFDEDCFPFASKDVQDMFGERGITLSFDNDYDEGKDLPTLHDADVEVLQELRNLDNVPREPDVEVTGHWSDNWHEAGDDDLMPEHSSEVREGSKYTRSGRISQPPSAYWIASPSALCLNLAAVESIIKAKEVFEPRTYKEAMLCDDAEEWKESIQKELSTLLANDTFEVIEQSPVPPGRRVVKSKWVFKVKNDSEGNFLS